MADIIKKDLVDINLNSGSISRSFLSHTIGSGDEDANRFGIRAYRDGSPIGLTGCSCQAIFINAEGTKIALTDYGTVHDNEAYVTLPQACYNVEGQFCLAIKIVGGGVTGTMRIVDGIVCNTGSTGTVAPTESVPTYQEIIAQYDAMVDATEDAEDAVAEAGVFTGRIPGFGELFAYNALDAGALEEGYYAHGNPSTISHGGNTKYVPKIRMFKGLTYSFINVYAYFCTIVYDNGTSVNLADSASPATTSVTVVAADDGYAYVTVNTGSYDSAMMVEGFARYSGVYFTGYSCGLRHYSMNGITPNNYSSHLPTLADAKDNTVYQLVTTQEMTVDGTMTDVPDRLKESGTKVSLLFNIGNTGTVPCVQVLFVATTGETMMRNTKAATGGAVVFDAWKCFTADMVHMPRVIITPANYASLLPSLDDPALAGTIYDFIAPKTMTAKHGGLWANVPKDMERQQCVGSIITTGKTGSIGNVQIMILANIGKVLSRCYSGTNENPYWTPWTGYGQQDVIIAADGSGDFTSFTEGIAYAVQFPGCHVHVMPGTYDIIDEYETLYGSDFFTNYTSSATDKGVVLTNDIVVECAPNAYIVCDYNGNNTYVQNIFSPLNAKQTAGGGGFTLINANVTSRNVRYAMHDERNQSPDYYHNKYIGCHFNHDKESGSGYRNCIGGGLGKNGLIEIENCTFENPSDTGYIVSYHNSKASGARSNVFIRNSIVKGSVRFSYYGESTLVSTMHVTNCKLNSAPVVTQETSSYSTVNVEMIAWNNVIGS